MSSAGHATPGAGLLLTTEALISDRHEKHPRPHDGSNTPGSHRGGAERGRDGAKSEGWASSHGVQVGQRIAHFRLRRFIAKGGMGEVWEAWDEELRRSVAHKLVLPERIDARSLALSAREAHAGGRLAHPSIVTTLGHGTDGGRAWIAQELVEGSWNARSQARSHFKGRCYLFRPAAAVGRGATSLLPQHPGDAMNQVG